MKSFIKARKYHAVLACLLVPLLASCRSPRAAIKPLTATVLPQPRRLTQKEKSELIKSIIDRFNVEPAVGYRAAGSFRFVNTEDFLYADRTDIGSVALSVSKYGVSADVLDTNTIGKEVLLPRIEAYFAKTGLKATGRKFAGFQDEFVGAAQPRQLTPDFDPRTVSKHVARTAAFDRVIDGVPVFGSELLVGLMPDGNPGRLRFHWPQISRNILVEAKKLQKAVRNKRWTLPRTLRSDDIEILDITAGIGHSGFADPGFKAQPAVRVVFRRVARNTPFPISSTSYKYFDAPGREIVFSVFAVVPSTPADQKPQR